MTVSRVTGPPASDEGIQVRNVGETGRVRNGSSAVKISKVFVILYPSGFSPHFVAEKSTEI